MTFKPDSLEAFIFFAAQIKAINKMHKLNLAQVQSLGICDDGESALVDSLMLGLERLDEEFKQLLSKLCERTDKGAHIIAALQMQLNEKECNDENRNDN